MGFEASGSKIKMSFDPRNPASMIDAFELMLEKVDAKECLRMSKKVVGMGNAINFLARYYEVLSRRALSDVHEATIGAIQLAILMGETNPSPRPIIKSNGEVALPERFLDLFPEAAKARQSFKQFSESSEQKFDAAFSLGAKAAGLFSKRVHFGRRSTDGFDYWPITFHQRLDASADALVDLDREDVANALMDDMLRSSFPSGFVKRRGDSDSVVTFGSCFAVNLARSLQMRNIQCKSFRIEEAINTTRANRLFLDYVFSGRQSETDYFEKAISPEQKSNIANAIRSASMIVLTVGVAPVTEWKDTGKLCILHEGYRDLFQRGEIVQRFTTVEENRDHLTAIYDLLKAENPSAEIFVTLSPVPLMGVADGSSVMMRDVLSKSTLRLAIEETARQRKFIYWPSFEVVKWAAPHVEMSIDYQAYGADDHNSRHVSSWLIDAITSKFIDYTFDVKPASVDVI